MLARLWNVHTALSKHLLHGTHINMFVRENALSRFLILGVGVLLAEAEQVANGEALCVLLSPSLQLLVQLQLVVLLENLSEACVTILQNTQHNSG